MRKIIVVGGGFAGLNVIKHLHKRNAEILVIDKLNYHQFQPLFYQVATSRLEASSISFPLRKIFQKYTNVSFRLAEVTAIRAGEHILVTDIGEFEYDELIIATGCTTNFFGNQEVQTNAFPMKSIPETLALRNKILENYEQAFTADSNTLSALYNIVVVGGGPTGVELAGALIEMKKNVLPKDYPDWDFSALNVYLIEAGPNLLGPMSNAAHIKSKEYLEEMGVKVLVNTSVQGYDGAVVRIGDNAVIPSKLLIWAAGVTGNMIAGIPEDAIVRGNRIRVDAFNQVAGLSNVYAIGDIAYMETSLYPKGHPQVANVAINQGKRLAINLGMRDKSNWKAFEYKDQGSMATIGKRKAVVDLPKFSFQGRLAWLVWMFLHLMLILSVRNKLIIFINWMMSYFTNDTALRLIIKPSLRKQVRSSNE